MTRIIEINDWSQLSHHWLLWQSLLAETRGATYFQSIEWLEAYGRHFGHRQRLRVLMVSDADGSPIG
ncbi:MAG TPA: hypothetical protein VGH32_01395, partial [Pirellulales bacterium]